jgi:hypothetical protein
MWNHRSGTHTTRQPLRAKAKAGHSSYLHKAPARRYQQGPALALVTWRNIARASRRTSRQLAPQVPKPSSVPTRAETAALG